MSQAVGLLFLGRPISEIAKTVGKHVETVRLWQRNPLFQQALEDFNRDAVNVSMRRYRYLVHRLLEVQARWLDSEDGNLALRAAHQLNQICKLYPREGQPAAVETLEIPTLSRAEIQAEIARCRQSLAAMEEPLSSSLPAPTPARLLPGPTDPESVGPPTLTPESQTPESTI